MTTSVDSTLKQQTLGHLALHYRPGDEQAARRLLEMLGFSLVDNGPKPGEDGFCTVLVDPGSANHADNIMFLSQLTPAQQALEDAIREQLHIGQADEHPAVTEFRDLRTEKPESAAHIGLRYGSFDALEQALVAIQGEAGPGGLFEGRVTVTKYPPRPGLDADVDARIAASPIFTGDEPPSFGKHWVQCFIRTDLFGFGILAFGQTIELDYVFEPFFAAPPTFGR